MNPLPIASGAKPDIQPVGKAAGQTEGSHVQADARLQGQTRAQAPAGGAVSIRDFHLLWTSRPQPLRFRTEHLLFVLVATLDVVMTWTILQLGGSEVNPLADAVIHRFGLPGMVAYKFALVLFIILLAELIAEQRPRHGRFLAITAVVMTCIPVALGSYYLSAGLL